MAEPPGIFIGRGEHPLRGKWKPRVTAKDVTLNLGKDAKTPQGNWGKIICDNDSMWLASWMDVLTEKRKYVWLADTSGLKQDRDKEKYEKAVKLGNVIFYISHSLDLISSTLIIKSSVFSPTTVICPILRPARG